MEAVLTPEQKAKAAELKERHSRMRPGLARPGRGPDGDKQGPPPDH